jgi:valyl-tRNA synthetase
VNIDEEIEKCDKKLALVIQSAEKLRKTVMDEKNVPENVREANKEKLETYETEITVLKQTMEMFASLK